MTLLPHQSSSLFLLPLAPWTLHRAAAVTPPPTASILGSLATMFVLGVVLAGARAGTSAPALDVPAYFRLVATLSLFFAMLLTIPAFVLLAPRVNASRGLSPLERANLCAVLLTPLTLILPAIAWSVMRALYSVEDPSFGLPPGKPGWFFSEWLPFAASGHWLWLGPPAAAMNAAVARRRIHDVLPRDAGELCKHCGYSLSGLPPGGACPECGGGKQQMQQTQHSSK